VLRVDIDSPTYENARYGDSAVIDSVATYDAEVGELTVFVVNRSTDQSTRVALATSGLGSVRVLDAQTLSHEDVHWRASADDAHTFGPENNNSVVVNDDGTVSVDLPAVSWSVIRLAVNPT